MTRWFWKKSDQIRSWLPKLQCHRGYWIDGARENTLASIKKAVELGFEMVEFDVRLAAGDEVILFHDEGFDQKLIHKTPLSELQKKLEANSFKEVLEWLVTNASKNLKLNIELKTDEVFDSVLERKIVALIEEFNLAERVLVSSFNPLSLARIKRLNPHIFRAQLISKEKHPKNKWYLQKGYLNFLARPHVLNLRHTDWNQAEYGFLKDVVPVVLWTFNEVDQIRNLSPLIHGIISDKITPEILKHERKV